MASNAAEVHKLRGELEARFGRAILPSGAPSPERSDGFRTGVAAIDALLPQGIQRGTLSLWTGDASAGRTAALRALVLHNCARGATVALVDASLTLDATFGCTPTGPIEGLWVVRPPDASRAAEGSWAAEALLRAGIFDLVILDGCTPDAAQGHRLRTLARERDAGVVVATAGARSEERGVSDLGHGVGTASYAPASVTSRAATFPTLVAERPGRATFATPGDAGPVLLDSETRTVTPSLLAPRSSLLGFRADVRLEFRRAERTAGEGLMPGGRFRSRARVVLAKHGSSVPTLGEREVEVVHEPADCLRTHIPAPDRSPGGR